MSFYDMMIYDTIDIVTREDSDLTKRYKAPYKEKLTEFFIDLTKCSEELFNEILDLTTLRNQNGKDCSIEKLFELKKLACEWYLSNENLTKETFDRIVEFTKTNIDKGVDDIITHLYNPSFAKESESVFMYLIDSKLYNLMGLREVVSSRKYQLTENQIKVIIPLLAKEYPSELESYCASILDNHKINSADFDFYIAMDIENLITIAKKQKGLTLEAFKQYLISNKRRLEFSLIDKDDIGRAFKDVIINNYRYKEISAEDFDIIDEFIRGKIYYFNSLSSKLAAMVIIGLSGTNISFEQLTFLYPKLLDGFKFLIANKDSKQIYISNETFRKMVYDLDETKNEFWLPETVKDIFLF